MTKGSSLRALLTTTSVLALIATGSSPALAGHKAITANQAATTVAAFQFYSYVYIHNGVTIGAADGFSVVNNGEIGANPNAPPPIGGLDIEGVTLDGGIYNALHSGTNGEIFGQKNINIQTHNAAIYILNSTVAAGGITNAGLIDAATTFNSKAQYNTLVNGIEIQGGSFAGGIDNSGAITAEGSDNNDGQDHDAVISVNGIVENTGVFAGTISNAGLVWAAAQIFSGHTGASHVTAVANGLYISGGFSGGVVNNGGTIGGQATAHDAQSVLAHAVGLNIQSTAAPTGGIANSSGEIIGIASAWHGDGGNVVARGTGIYVATANGFSGGIGNGAGGVIIGQATADTFGGINANDITAVAHGILIDPASFAGGISNGGSVGAVATAYAGSTSGAAHAARIVAVATAISVTAGSSTGGGLLNTGTVAALAQAYGHAATMTAVARGIDVAGAGLGGDVANSGTVTAIALAQSGDTLKATAVGIALAPTAAASSGVFNRSGGVIYVTAQASSGSLSESAGATGILIAGVGTSGSVENGGNIYVLATAEHGVALTAMAHGVGIGISADISGGVVQTGTISVVAAEAHGPVGTAKATGIAIHAPNVSGGLTNAGTILVTAQVSHVSQPGTALAEAFGIGVGGGTFAGGITNTGLIEVSATAGSLSTPTKFAALAAGIDVTASDILDGIDNGGTISVVASASAGGSFKATATGIHVSVGTFGGGVTNSGLIDVSASATSGRSTLTADAYGLHFDGSQFAGGALNEGTISVQARVESTPNGTAAAWGIDVTTATFAGGVSNAGLIGVSAIEGGDLEAPSVYGIFTGGTVFSGGISNGVGGTISVEADNAVVQGANVWGIDVASATFAGGVTNAGLIRVSGTDHNAGSIVLDVHGIELSGSVFSGGAVNVGTIQAVAAAHSGGGVAAIQAWGIQVTSDTFNNGVTNNGLIHVNATAQKMNPSVLRAYGIDIGGSHFSGGVANGGAISVSVSAMSDGGNAPVQAWGIGITSNTFTGGVTNSGFIYATANETKMSAPLDAFGIEATSADFAGGLVNEGGGTIAAFVNASHGALDSLTADGVAVDGTGSFSGGIVNQAGGTIAGQVTFYALGSVTASAGGIVVSENFNNGIDNAGSVLAVVQQAALLGSSQHSTGTAIGIRIAPAVIDPTFTGGVSNSGLISAAAYLGGYAGNAIARATGVYVNNFVFTGGILNLAGTIAAAATANVHTGTKLAAYARGIHVVTPSSFGGGITNSGLITASAQAGAVAGAEPSDSFIAEAEGIFVEGSGSFSDGIINVGGTIGAYARAYDAHSATAQAQGVKIYGTSSFNGGVQNTSTANHLVVPVISAVASASHAHKALASATGVYVATSIFNGGIANVGTIAAAAFARSAASATAIARGVFVNGVSSYSGGLTNGGTISAFAEVSNGFVVPLAQATGVAFTVGSSLGPQSVVNNQGMLISGVAETFTRLSGSTNAQQINVTAVARGVSYSVGVSGGGISNEGLITAQAVNTLNISGFSSVGNTIDIHATATGVALDGGAMAGQLHNLSTGTIQAFAHNTGTIYGFDSWANTVNSTAYAAGVGVSHNSVYQTGGLALIFNEGTIAATAVNDMTFIDMSNSGHTSPPSAGNVLNINASATGIYVTAPTVTGGISNTGLISALAQAVPSITEAHTTGSSYTVSAGAWGIDVSQNSFSNGITNGAGGIIRAGALASPALDLSQVTALSLRVHAGAYGIDVHETSNFTGGVHNAGTIVARATATVQPGAILNAVNSHGLLPTLSATATGISVYRASIFSGGVTNSGTIQALAQAGGGAAILGGTVSAFAAGIDIHYPSSFSGAVVNQQGGLISAEAHATGLTAHAVAQGIAVYATAFSNSISNAGTILATATASHGPLHATGNHVAATAAGIFTNISVFSGGITNSGVIGVLATATEKVLGGTQNTLVNVQPALAGGIVYYGSLFSGGITNSGMIDAAAMNTGTLGISSGTNVRLTVGDQAGGIVIGGQTVTGNHTKNDIVQTFSGGITNTGTISALAMNQVTASLSNGSHNTVTASAGASGIFMNVGDFDYINNVNTIIVSAQTSFGVAFLGGSNNVAHGTAGALGMELNVNTFGSGSITNSGLIVATAVNTLQALYSNSVGNHAAGTAAAFGIDLYNIGLGTITSPISNSGTIQAVALDTVSGAFNATGTNYLKGTAEAAGIAVTGGRVTNSIVNSGSGVISAGAVSNIGTITSQSGSIGVVILDAYASGVDEGSTGPLGGIFSITNGPAASILATAQATGGVGSTSANAGASGISLHAPTLTATITNSGIISADAWATAAVAHATASGITLHGNSIVNQITNTGLISGLAVATSTGPGTASAFAAGVEISAVSVYSQVSNTGLISGSAYATGSDSGGVVATAYGVNIEPPADSFAYASFNNGATGTIAGFASAIGNGLSATAHAAGIHVSHFNTSILLVSNAGLISGTALSVLNAHVTGSSQTATAKAHAAGIAAHDEYLAYGITNSGTIQASAEATLNINFDDGYIDQATAIARATGISLHGYEVGGFGPTAGAIFNTGTISALAIANIGTISGTPDFTNTPTAIATARGIDIHGAYVVSVIGNGTSGVISAMALAHAPGFNASANAAGVDLHGRSLYAEIYNYGQIEGVAVAGTTGNGATNTTAARAHATAAGVLIHGSTTFGLVANLGTISSILGEAEAYGTIAAHAHATGVGLSGRTFFGGVVNDGTIRGAANATGGSWAGAHARGVSISGESVQGSVQNSGTIYGLAQAIGHHAWAHGTGVSIGARSFLGGVSNSGLIVGTAYASNGTVAYDGTGGSSWLASASANGVLIKGHTVQESGSAVVLNTGVMVAVATSAGTLTIAATTDPTFTYEANAVGLGIDAHYIGGAIANTDAGGGIQAYASARPTVFINGASSSVGIDADGYATGLGVNAHTLAGEIYNSRFIYARAHSTPTVTVSAGTSNHILAIAGADGVALRAHTLTGGIYNSGNSGVLSAEAVAHPVVLAGTSGGTPNSISGSVTADAAAYGVHAHVHSLYGGVSNTGLISIDAEAIAKPSYGTAAGSWGADAHAKARGIDLSDYSRSSSINGGILNGSTAVISVQAVAVARAHGSASAHATANAIGVKVNTATFNGDIVNQGLIQAEATVSAHGGTAQSSYGTAIGIDVNVRSAWGSDGGLITNSGVIWAEAKGSRNSDLSATAIKIEDGSVAPGTINNTGLIAGVIAGDHHRLYSATAIDLSGAAAGPGTVINLDPGNVNPYSRVIGDIDLSSGNADTVNVASSYINGGIYGGGGTAFASNGQMVNFEPEYNGAWSPISSNGGFLSSANATYFGFTAWNDGASGAINHHSQFRNTWSSYGITGVQQVNLAGGSNFVMSPTAYMTNIGTLAVSNGETLVNYVTAPTKNNIVNGVGTNGQAPTFTNVGTINIGTNTTFLAYETPGWYANTNLYDDFVNYGSANTSFGTVSSYSPLFTAYFTPFSTSGGDATLTLTRVAFGSVAGLDGKEQAFGNFLEQQYDTKAPDLRAIENLFALNGSQYGQFMSVVDNEVNMQAWQPLIDVWDNFEASITNRLGSQGGPQFAGMPNLNGAIGKGSTNLASMMNSVSDAGSPLGSGAQTPANGGTQGYGFWGRGYGIFSNGDNTSTMTGFSENTGGVIGGFDMAATDNLVLGGAFDYAHGSLSLNNGMGSGSNDQYQVALYGRYDANPWYVNGVAGVGWGQYNQSRSVNSLMPQLLGNGQEFINPVSGTATANYGAEEFAVYGETGYTYKMDQYVLQPLLGLGYIHTGFDSFTESGAGAGDLTVGSASVNSLISTLGGRASTTFELDGGGKIIPSVLLGWQHQYLDTAMTLSESLASSPYAGFFQEKGPDYGRDSALLGAGLEADIWARTKLFLDYNAKLNGGYTEQAVSGGLRIDF